MAKKEVSVQELITLLTNDGYCLMIDEESKMEHYDEQGNLVVCTDSGEKWIAVPNIEEIRKLYNLPLNGDEKDGIIKTEILNLKSNSEDEDDSPMVWMGQRTQRCQEATKALIKLVDSPKYQKLMNDKSTIKVKVWEKIASELQEQGFKIANTVKDAGEKTFQKWRNMERTYWKYLKNPSECGEDKRKKKPSFFDDMDAVLSKQKKSLKKHDSNCSSEVDANEDDCDDMTNALPLDAFRRSNNEPLSREVVHMLVRLVNLKYQNELINSDYSQQMKIWESIYEEITAAGLKVSETKRTGAIKLGLKWKSLERRHLNRRNKKTPRKLYNPKLRKSLLIEMTKAKPIKLEEPMDIADVFNSEERQLKEGEIAPKAIEALLTLIDSEKYQELFNGGGKKARIWDKIYDDMEEMGYEIPGHTKREKIQRLFQKWRNMKRTFIKYQIEKDVGRSRKKPLCYDLLLKIISKDIFRDSEDIDMTTDLIHESKNSLDFDFSAEQMCVVGKASTSGVSSPTGQASTSTNQSSADITDILLQIKNLHETALAVQQENLSKVVFLLEEQVREQKTLNSLFTQYVVNYANKKNKSKGRSSSNNVFNEDNLNTS